MFKVSRKWELLTLNICFESYFLPLRSWRRINNSVHPLFSSQTIWHGEQIVGQGSGFLCILLAGQSFVCKLQNGLGKISWRSKTSSKFNCLSRFALKSLNAVNGIRIKNPIFDAKTHTNKLAKLGDAIAISNLKLSITDPLFTDWLTGEGARKNENWNKIANNRNAPAAHHPTQKKEDKINQLPCGLGSQST